MFFKNSNQPAVDPNIPVVKQYDREYRPKNINEYLGNEQVKFNIKNLAKNNNLPQLILFVGESGTGKTSFARLLSKHIQCNDQVDGDPCGVCPICLEIDSQFIQQGKSVKGVREFNMSDRTTKADAGDLITAIRQRPLPPYKKMVIIVDEVHRMSNSAQDAILKDLEDIPPHVQLFLCTTDPEMLRPALVSRTTQYRIRKPTVKEMADRLEEICIDKNFQYDMQALRLIVKHRNKVPRDSIKGLQRVSDSGPVTVGATIDALDIVTEDVYIDFFDALDKDISAIMEYVNNIEEKGVDYGSFLQGLLRFIMDGIDMSRGVKMDTYLDETYKASRRIFKRYDYIQLEQLLTYATEATGNISSAVQSEALVKVFALKVARLLEHANKSEKELLKARIAEKQLQQANEDMQDGGNQGLSKATRDIIKAAGASTKEHEKLNVKDLIKESTKVATPTLNLKDDVTDIDSLKELWETLD